MKSLVAALIVTALLRPALWIAPEDPVAPKPIPMTLVTLWIDFAMGR